MNTKCELQTILATDSVSQIITYGIRGEYKNETGQGIIGTRQSSI